MLHEPFRPDYPVETSRLTLRPHRPTDLEDLLAFHSDPEVVRFLPWPVRDRAATEAALAGKLDQAVLTEPGQWLVLAVELRETGTVIGEVLLKWTSAEHRQGELGFAFGRAFHGKGYAAEAATAMLRLGFEQLDLHRVEATCLDDNQASARLLRRLGFTQEARFVDNAWFEGAWAGKLVFGLTAERWQAPVGDGGPDEIRSIVEGFFAAFTSGPGVEDRMTALRDMMLPEAVIISSSENGLAVNDVDTFITPRQKMLTDGTLVDFHEEAQSGRLEVFGGIAHWFGRYSKGGVLGGAQFEGGGMKSMQLVRTAAGWRISAAAWEDDAPGS